MKNLRKTGLFLLGVSMLGCAQKRNVSQNAEQTLSQKFPKANKVSWEKENEDEWEAEFKMDGKEFSANFNENGDLLETESEIENNEVPSRISQVMAEKYAEAKIKKVFKVERKDGIFYEYEFKLNGNTREVLFDSSGNVVKNQTSEDDDEDKMDDD